MTSAANTLIVAQSGTPTPVVNASLAGVIQTAQHYAQITHIYGLVNGLEGGVYDNLIDLSHEPVETLERLLETPAAILGSGQYKVASADYDGILDTFLAHNTRYFVHIGGSGAMYTTHRLAQIAGARGYDLAVMGVPKSINNDLVGTDHTPGYGSVARFLALAVRDAGRDLEAMVNVEDVMIFEAPGRNAGWLAAATVLGKAARDEAPHLVYVPEIPFAEDQFLRDVAQIQQHLGRVFVVVGAGVRDQAGQLVGEPEVTNLLTNGVAAYLAGQVRNRLNLQVQALRPGLLGRAFSACVSTVDRYEAWQVGHVAVKHLLAGESGQMVSLKRVSNSPYQSDTGLVSLADVAGPEKTMPRDFINQAGTMITPAFVDYALPLIDGPLSPLARLKNTGVGQH